MIPSNPTIPKLRDAAADCRACELWKRGTQTVFGEGGPKVRVMLVGEQPFKWEPRGKRRIHKKPNAMEITACKPWIEAEIAVLKPGVIVCLGATAAQALLGRQFRVTAQRGTWISSPYAPFVMATVHPLSLLRAPDDETRHRETERFVEDLRLVHEALEKHKVA